MPTYRYKCEQCGTFTEREYRMSTCPAVIQSPCCDSLCNANRVPYPAQTTFKDSDSSPYKGVRRKSPPVHNVDLSAAESRIKPGRSERDKRYS
jgi:hypothetical protein